MSIAHSKYLSVFEFSFSCDNHYMIEAKTPETEGKMVIEFKTQKGHENKMFKDQREKERSKVLMEFEDDSESDEDFKMPSNATSLI